MPPDAIERSGHMYQCVSKEACEARLWSLGPRDRKKRNVDAI